QKTPGSNPGAPTGNLESRIDNLRVKKFMNVVIHNLF
ncbi:MAG: hypothetical protein RL536_318, partial [Candidatus Parcubacteria bacterium]